MRQSSNHRRNRSLAYILFILAAIIIRLAISYYPFLKFGYIVPPGGDPVNHAGLIDSILAGQISGEYPWTFHYISFLVAKLFGLNSMQSMLYIIPSLIILPALGVLFFLNKLFDKKTAFVGFVIMLFASNYGLKALGDGNYPNIIAAGLLMPILFVFFVKSFTRRKVTDYLLMFVAAILMIFTHHLTIAYTLVVILLFLPLYFWLQKNEDETKSWRAVITVIILLVVCALVLFLSPLGEIFSKAIGNFERYGSFLATNTYNKPFSLGSYSAELGTLTYSGGLVSLIYLIFMLSRDNLRRDQRISIILVLGWFVSLFLCSRTGLVGLPGRFTRELGPPLVIAMSIALYDIYSLIDSKRLKATAIILFSIIIYMNFIHFGGSVYASPDYYKNMVWLNDKDKEKIDMINNYTNSGEIIITNEDNPYFDYYLEGSVHLIAVPLKSEEQLRQKIAKEHAKYIFISRDFNINYRNYKGEDYKSKNTEVAVSLERFSIKYKPLLELGDGSKLLCVACDEDD